MTTSKRLRRPMLIHEKNFGTFASAFIKSNLTSTTNISQTTENHLNNINLVRSSQDNHLLDLQQQTLHCEKSKLMQDHFEMISKTTTKRMGDKTQNNNEDDWVCPVAVALRRAGYNVPLRPSKSWLERDRKKQALLRERPTSSKIS